MRILLTGGSGFIGKNIKEGLENDFRIYAPSHKELDILDSVKLREYIKKNKINTVIHAAVKGGENVLEDILRMFFSIHNSLDLLERFINFGSGAEYGKHRDLKKVKEEELGTVIPEDNYGLGKLICSQLSKGNKKIVTLIPFGIFGKYEDYRFKFISNSIVKNLLSLPIKIKQNVIFDYLYINDLMPIVKFFLNNKKFYGDYNVTPTRSISLKEIAEIINKISDKRSKINIINKNLNYQYTGNNKKLRKIVPYIEFSPFNVSINNLYSFYTDKVERLDKNAIIQDIYFYKSKMKTS